MKLYLKVFLLIFSSTAFANIALISYHPEFRNVDLNMKELEKYSDKAVADGAKVILFAEGAIDGYVQLADGDDWTYWSDHTEKWCKSNYTETNDCQNVDEVAQGQNNDSILKYWQKYAADNDLHLIFQIPEKDGDLYFNSAYVVNKEGIIAKHRKNRLVITDTGYASQGSSGTVVKLPFGDVGIFICADGHSPDLFEEYAEQNVFKFIGLGYGITPAKYEQHATLTKLEGLIVDSNQYMGLITKNGREIFNYRLKDGYVLYDYNFKHLKSVVE